MANLAPLTTEVDRLDAITPIVIAALANGGGVDQAAIDALTVRIKNDVDQLTAAVGSPVPTNGGGAIGLNAFPAAQGHPATDPKGDTYIGYDNMGKPVTSSYRGAVFTRFGHRLS